MQRRSISCIARLCRPLPVSVAEDQAKHGVAAEFSNRNPRNLEMIGIAQKRAGWKFQAPRKDYYHKLELTREGKHTTATLTHTSGYLVISASTREQAISQHLPSPSDINACFNVGRVMAHRCHQIGIDSMMFEPESHGEGVKKFIEGVSDGGITLEEADAQPYIGADVGMDYDAPS